MNILKEIATAKRNQNQKVVMKRTRFGKKEKTAKCSICGKSGTRLKFGKQTIIRCSECIKQLNSRNDKHVPVFQKASNIK